MNARIGIRREDKNEWERRTPLIPAHAAVLKEEHGIDVHVQSSPIRAFSREEYTQAGAIVTEDLTDCPVIFAVKEIPERLIEQGKTYVFFSHTIKGQEYNMPMLQRILDLRCQLIDYEEVTDEKGARLVCFSKYAGLAGMIDGLWALGRRLAWEKIQTPFSQIRQTFQYDSLEDAKEAVRQVGRRIAHDGLPRLLTPLICGFTGYGNVSRSAQEIFDLLPVREIAPTKLRSFDDSNRHCVYKVVFGEQDMVESTTDDGAFQLQDYYDHPEAYRSRFERYIPFLTLLVNGIFWTRRYPKFLTKRYLKEQFSLSERLRLRVICDISCEIEGAIECTLRATTPGEPIYVYDPLTGRIRDGHQGRGVVVLAVDNLPCELPRESSAHFSAELMPFVPDIAQADYSVPFDRCSLPPAIRHAVIAWQGQLTSDFRYIKEFL